MKVSEGVEARAHTPKGVLVIRKVSKPGHTPIKIEEEMECNDMDAKLLGGLCEELLAELL